MIITFSFGYRTFELFNGFFIHPIELIMFASVIRILVFKPKKYHPTPYSIYLVASIFTIYLFVDIFTRYNIFILNEFKNSIHLFTIFFIFQFIKLSNRYLKNVFKTYILSITIISCLGILEFSFPHFIANIFGHGINPDSLTNKILFQRLLFLFWGSPLGANLIPPIFPMILYLHINNKQHIKTFTTTTAIILINLIAVYLSGNRISWLILTIMLFIMLIQFRNRLFPNNPNIKLYVTAILLGFIIYIYSQPVEGRYLSMFKAIAGQIDSRYDSSSANRMYKAQIAISSIISNPFGLGWSSQGWVHNDILQIAATTGVFNAFIFIFGLFNVLSKLYRKLITRAAEYYSFYYAAFNIMIYVTISFFLNGNLLLIQTGAPLFLMWAIFSNKIHYLSEN
tara:strand:- start:2366 stop:3553 length:1188 start_codon:yes stop_codon:yes gene_type:complete